MEPKYSEGQKVIVKPARSRSQSARDSDIGRYAGQRGTVTDYYWLNPSVTDVFYIYTVQFDIDQREIVLHEDEIEADTAKARKKLGLSK